MKNQSLKLFEKTQILESIFNGVLEMNLNNFKVFDLCNFNVLINFTKKIKIAG
jgi:hypothetical protein